MKHLIFKINPSNQYKVAILIKETALTKSELSTHYVTPLVNKGLNEDDFIGLGLTYNEAGKAPVKLIKSHLELLLAKAQTLGITTLLVADGHYFKTLTKERKSEPHHGYIKPCAIKGYEHLNVILSVNYQALFYNPVIQDKLTMSLETLYNHLNNSHVNLGTGIIQFSAYPDTYEEIKNWLEALHKHPVLSCDIETYSLDFWKAGIATISFAWNQHEGIAFAVDSCNKSELKPERHADKVVWGKYYHYYKPDGDIQHLLREFFDTYQGKLLFHGVTFDAKVLIYVLYMRDMLDNEGLLNGLDILYRNTECTKLITYMATNTTAGNKLGLKHNAFEFAGNYAQEDIQDIRRIPLPDLLEYNLVDALATFYVYNKNKPILIQDDQLKPYTEIMVPSLKVITNMELVGMPMDYDQICKTNHELEAIRTQLKKYLANSPLIQAFEWREQRHAMINHNLLLKKKVKPMEDFKAPFNPGSDQQVQRLLHHFIGFPVTDKTLTGNPAVGAKSLNKILAKLIHDFDITPEELKL